MGKYLRELQRKKATSLRRFKNHVDFWGAIRLGLETHLASRRNERLNAGLNEGIALYAFSYHEISVAGRRRRAILPHLGPLLLVTYDILRTLPANISVQAAVQLAASARMIFESHATFRFIARSENPAHYAGRYSRYSDVERILHDINRPKGEPAIFSDHQLEELRKRCPEWITAKGKLKNFWTADDRYRSIRQIAAAAGLEGQYHTVYGPTSQFVHSSALGQNVFRTSNSHGPMAEAHHCETFAMFAVVHALDLAQEACRFFDVPFDAKARQSVRAEVVRSVVATASRRHLPE